MRIDHDKVSGALYIKIRNGEYDHTEDFSERADVYVDVDAAGNVLGLEALSFEDLAEAIEEHGGALELPDRLSGDEEPGIAVDPDSEVEISRGPSETVGEVVEGVSETVGNVAGEVSESVGDVAEEVSESVGDEEAGSPRRPGRRARR